MEAEGHCIFQGSEAERGVEYVQYVVDGMNIKGYRKLVSAQASGEGLKIRNCYILILSILEWDSD